MSLRERAADAVAEYDRLWAQRMALADRLNHPGCDLAAYEADLAPIKSALIGVAARMSEQLRCAVEEGRLDE